MPVMQRALVQVLRKATGPPPAAIIPQPQSDQISLAAAGSWSFGPFDLLLNIPPGRLLPGRVQIELSFANQDAVDGAVIDRLVETSTNGLVWQTVNTGPTGVNNNDFTTIFVQLDNPPRYVRVSLTNNGPGAPVVSFIRVITGYA